ESRMHGELKHAPPERRDPAFAIERTERVQQIATLRERARRRGLKPAQRGRSPCGKLERELRELDLRDFRRTVGVETFALRPEAQADAGAETSRAAGPLIGG